MSRNRATDQQGNIQFLPTSPTSIEIHLHITQVLLVLDLWHNQMTHRGAQCVADALQNHPVSRIRSEPKTLVLESLLKDPQRILLRM